MLLDAGEDELRKATTGTIAGGILRMRQGQVVVEPGYDGEYGHVRVFSGDAGDPIPQGEHQMTLF